MENETKLPANPNGNLGNDNTVSLDEAISRIRAYREYATRVLPAGEITKAIFIPIDDVQDIINRFNNTQAANGQDIKGIRVYFSLLPDMPDDKFVHGLVVPVRQDGTDIVITDPEEESSIYDFTVPCPSYCDQTSELYKA